MSSNRDPSQISAFLPVYSGVYRAGKVDISGPVPWPDGTRVRVQIARPDLTPSRPGHAVLVGFGPVGRWAADVLDRFKMPYALIERNPATVAAQRALGRRVVEGDASLRETLVEAGIASASFLLLTIPDEKAGMKAVECARSLNPSLVIMARMEHPSSGMRARQLGADVVISAEIAVAKEFHESLLTCLGANSVPARPAE